MVDQLLETINKPITTFFNLVSDDITTKTNKRILNNLFKNYKLWHYELII